MFVLTPNDVDNSIFLASNIAEDDEPIWDMSTTYDTGDRVLVAGNTHKIYESIQDGNNGNSPLATNANEYWILVGASNRWKAFDKKLTDQASNVDEITYTLQAPRLSDGMAFFNLLATDVRIQIEDSDGLIIEDLTKSVVNNENIGNWFDYFFEEIDYDTEAIFTGLSILFQYKVHVTISVGSGDAKVGQIVFGKIRELGKVITPGTGTGINDYSRKERDIWGNPDITERDYADTVDFTFIVPNGNESRLKRILSPLRAKPAVYFMGEGTEQYGTTVYGFYESFYIPMSFNGFDNVTLEIESLV